VPAIIELLSKSQRSAESWTERVVRDSACHALGAFGPVASDATPVLVDMLYADEPYLPAIIALRDQEFMDRNPAENVEKPPCRPRENPVTDEHYERMLKGTRDQEFRDLITVAWECGPRPQELLAMSVRHVELANWHPVISAPTWKRRSRNSDSSSFHKTSLAAYTR
jgi:integrase